MTTRPPLEVTRLDGHVKLAGLWATYYLTPDDARRLARALDTAAKEDDR